MDGIENLLDPFDPQANYETKQKIFFQFYSSGSLTTQSFDEKIELLQLLGFLTYKLHEKDPDKYPNTLSVLKTLTNAFDNPLSHDAYVDYLEGISIVCDDLLYQCKHFKTPGNYKNGKEIADRIKDIINQWNPF